MSRINPSFLTYPPKPDVIQLRYPKKLTEICISGTARTKILKKSLLSLHTAKYQKTVRVQKIDNIPAKTFPLVSKAVCKASKFLRKVILESSSFFYSPRAQVLALKQLLARASKVQTLSLTSLETYYIKLCRSLKNIKLSMSEGSQIPIKFFFQMKRLNQLERVEVCVSDEDQALIMLKRMNDWINSKSCLLHITLLKAFWPYDNIEAVFQQNFKKVASVELNLGKLPSLPSNIDHDKYEAHLKFLRFLFEPVGKTQRRRKLFECIKLPGMKLQIDPKEYNSPPKIYSLLETFLSVYASSVVHVKEYSPENNLARLYFEITSLTSSLEVLELLKDIIEYKDIKYLHLELEVNGMTENDFNGIFEEVCKIERLEFVYVVSGSFYAEMDYPAEKYLIGLIEPGRRSQVELRG